MKIQISIQLLITALCCCTVAAQEKSQPPLVQLKIQSFDALTANARRVATALGLDADWDPGAKLSGAIGSPDLAGVDRKRAWQVAVATKGPGALPLIALYVPVANFDAFKTGLKDSSPLKGGDKPNPLIQAGEFAVVVFQMGQGGEISDEEKKKLIAWAPAGGAGTHLIDLALQLDEMTRQQVLQAMTMGRMIVAQSLSQQKLPAGAPVNPQAMTQMIGIYFDGFETLLKGLHRLEVHADFGDQMLSIAKTVQPRPDSELSRWFKSSGGGLAALANQLDPKATASVAGAFGENPAFMPMLKKLIRVSFQMQNQEVDEKLASQIDRLMEAMAPMRFVGSVDLGKTISYSGFYEFPKRGAKETYALFKEFFTDAMPSLAGKDKAYSSFEFKEGHHTVSGTPVDRFSMAFNLDAPMFKMPGQREALERLSNGGKMEFDYAVKANRLYLASPDKMSEALAAAARPTSASGLNATPNTALIGRANLLALIKQMLAVNPMLPAEIKEKFARLDPEGSDVRFRVDLDGRLSSRVDVPLKMFEAFRLFQSKDK
ncbi:MAG: hypothetical protein HYY23_11270 [Verrucomicrobia bacterium]|nr:hypothetical protein [Verrucomicrobiota bacterium]